MSGLLADKIAIVYGGGGAIGGASARVFAREGARVFLAGRTQAKLAAVARDIESLGGMVEHRGRSISLTNAQSTRMPTPSPRRPAASTSCSMPLALLTSRASPSRKPRLAEFEQPITATARAQFIAAQAVARHMVTRKRGVILTLTTPGGRIAGKGFLANGVFSAATEAFSRLIAAELGGSGIRVVCLRPDALLDAVALSGSREVFEGVSKRVGIPVHVMLEERGRTATLLGRLPHLAEVAEFAAFAASDRAGAMTGAVANLTCGSLTD